MDSEKDSLLATNGDYERQERNNVLSIDQPATTQTPTPSLWRLCYGYTLGVVLSLIWAASIGCAQALGGSVPMMELNAWRFAFLLVFCFPITCYYRLNLMMGSNSERLWVGLYCLMVCTYNALFYEASIYIPVTTLGGLEFTLVIVWLALISLVITRRLLALELTVAYAVCICGIVLLLQPRFMFGNVSETSGISTHPVCIRVEEGAAEPRLNDSTLDPVTAVYDTTPNTSTAVDTSLEISSADKGYAFTVASSIVYAMIVTTLQHRLNNVNQFQVLFWVGVCGTALSAGGMLAAEDPVFPSLTTCVMLLFGHSASASMSQILMNVALTIISSIHFAILSTLQMVFLLGAQYTVLKNVNPGHHNVVEVVGALLVLTGSVIGPAYTLYRESRSRKSESVPAAAADRTDPNRNNTT